MASFTIGTDGRISGETIRRACGETVTFTNDYGEDVTLEILTSSGGVISPAPFRSADGADPMAIPNGAVDVGRTIVRYGSGDFQLRVKGTTATVVLGLAHVRYDGTGFPDIPETDYPEYAFGDSISFVHPVTTSTTPLQALDKDDRPADLFEDTGSTVNLAANSSYTTARLASGGLTQGATYNLASGPGQGVKGYIKIKGPNL